MYRTKKILWSGSNNTSKKTLNESIQNFNCLVCQNQNNKGSYWTMLHPFIGGNAGNYMSMGQHWEGDNKFFMWIQRLQFDSNTECYNNRGTWNELAGNSNIDTFWWDSTVSQYNIVEIDGCNDTEEVLYDGTSTSSVAPAEITLSKAANQYSMLKFVLGDASNGSPEVYYLKVDPNKSNMTFTVMGTYGTSSNYSIYGSVWHFNGFDKIVSNNQAIYYQRNWETKWAISRYVSYTYSTSTTDFRVRPIRKISGIV